MLRLNYDREVDVLYVKLAPTDDSWGDEEFDDIIIHHDIETGELTCVTILDFWERFSKGTLPVDRLPVKLDFDAIWEQVRHATV